jgi:hypothetical protein
VQNGDVKTSIELDRELAAEVKRTVLLVGEKPATILRMAIRAGLPLVAVRFNGPAPDGYFADAYKGGNRAKFERAVGRKMRQSPER